MGDKFPPLKSVLAGRLRSSGLVGTGTAQGADVLTVCMSLHFIYVFVSRVGSSPRPCEIDK